MQRDPVIDPRSFPPKGPCGRVVLVFFSFLFCAAGASIIASGIEVAALSYGSSHIPSPPPAHTHFSCLFCLNDLRPSEIVVICSYSIPPHHRYGTITNDDDNDTALLNLASLFVSRCTKKAGPEVPLSAKAKAALASRGEVLENVGMEATDKTQVRQNTSSLALGRTGFSRPVSQVVVVKFWVCMLTLRRVNSRHASDVCTVGSCPV